MPDEMWVLPVPEQVRHKHPSIPYLDDHHLYQWTGKRVIVTEKMDGENTTIYPDGYCHARSVDSLHHESRSLVKGWAWAVGASGHLGDDTWLCVENMYAEHSIHYDNIEPWYVHSMWFAHCDDVFCASWDDTMEVAKDLRVPTVPVLFDGVFDRPADIRNFYRTMDLTKSEGFVIRLPGQIPLDEYADCVKKWVRPGHVQTDQHWMLREIKRNGLRPPMEGIDT